MVWFYRRIWISCRLVSCSLSIPLWSDFIPFSVKNEDATENYFQSHYGLILSLWKLCVAGHRIRAFNPTMVWFYHCCRTTRLFTLRPFNPTMVWFYQKWRCVCQSPTSRLRAFNPTMVWFYHAVVFLIWDVVYVPFNPTMVWFYLNVC